MANGIPDLSALQSWLNLGIGGILSYVILHVLRQHKAERDEWRAENREHRDAMFQMLTQVSDVANKMTTAMDATTREQARLCERLDKGFESIHQAISIQQSLSDLAARVGGERPKPVEPRADPPSRPSR